MFLIDPALAAQDWDGVNQTIRTILERAEAEIVSMRKWDERKLAYNIRGRTRGTYILCYFRAGGDKIQEIERDVRLSERIMRVLVLNAEHITQQDIEKATPAMRLEQQMTPAVETAEKPEAAKIELPDDLTGGVVDAIEGPKDL
jgi:small subunit ribosomal protein S6